MKAADDPGQEWLETAARLPELTSAEAAVVREVWKATLDPARRRRWSWVSMAFAVALGWRVSDAESGISALGWDGQGDLSKRLNEIVTADPGIVLLVVFEGADIPTAIESVRTAIGLPNAKLREVVIAFRSDRRHLCRLVQIMYRDPHSPLATAISPGAVTEVVGQPEMTPTPFTAVMEAPVPALPAEHQLWVFKVPADSTGARDVGLVTPRATEALRPGTWVVLTKAGSDEGTPNSMLGRLVHRGTKVQGDVGVEAFALGRISRSPRVGGRLLTYDRFMVCEPCVRIPGVLVGSGPEPIAAPERTLGHLLETLGCTLEEVPAAIPTLLAEDVLSEFRALPENFVASLVAVINSGKNVLLVGEPGCGKTATALALARACEQAGLVEGAAHVIGGESLEQLQSSPLVARSAPPNPFDYRPPSYEASAAPKLLVVDDIQLDVLKALIRELDRRSRSSSDDDQVWWVVATATPAEIMDEWGEPRVLTRQFLVMRIPGASADLAVETVVGSALPDGSLTKRLFLQLLTLEGHGLTPGILIDTLRYLESRLGSDETVKTAALLREALELCVFPYVAKDARTRIEAFLEGDPTSK